MTQEIPETAQATWRERTWCPACQRSVAPIDPECPWCGHERR